MSDTFSFDDYKSSDSFRGNQHTIGDFKRKRPNYTDNQISDRLEHQAAKMESEKVRRIIAKSERIALLKKAS